ncbi:MAG: hypothetical protein QME51_08705, partial [Planctomycetota bacterium]|nr:hypothetical protein [Planctomycetota bacterium]
ILLGLLIITGLAVARLLARIDANLVNLVGYLAGRPAHTLTTHQPPETITMTDVEEWKLQQKGQGNKENEK